MIMGILKAVAMAIIPGIVTRIQVNMMSIVLNRITIIWLARFGMF